MVSKHILDLLILSIKTWQKKIDPDMQLMFVGSNFLKYLDGRGKEFTLIYNEELKTIELVTVHENEELTLWSSTVEAHINSLGEDVWKMLKGD